MESVPPIGNAQGERFAQAVAIERLGHKVRGRLDMVEADTLQNDDPAARARLPDQVAAVLRTLG